MDFGPGRKLGLTKQNKCDIILIESEVHNMDWELIWWCVVGGGVSVFMLLGFIVTPKQKEKDITILHIGK